ncbi:hypothetical protein, partial [Actinomadura sp. B10D3]|uniref:hypothetical protein n=1 Tax=Actinomadura sp. B10D3 TaxID=3153557 RepID=UPI00325E1528
PAGQQGHGLTTEVGRFRRRKCSPAGGYGYRVSTTRQLPLGGCLAPLGFDVGWCRLDLILLHGPETAAAFLDAYETAAGRPVANIELWDLYTLRNSYGTVETWVPNYRDLGRTDLTADVLRTRHTSWTRQCLHRWNHRSSPSKHADSP